MLEVHIHDNMGERDEHLALGEGSMPYKECLLALNKCVPLILEMTSTDAFKKSLSMIKEVFC
jgi:sugar phosphate isomerase/epimerase